MTRPDNSVRTHDSPVALFAYNRPVETARVLAAVRDWAPSHLLLVTDGPRHDDADDARRCSEVAEILAGVDWDCRVERIDSTFNMGCRQRMASGLDWVFSRVDEAIILEDDCLPSRQFFEFMNEMLREHRNTPRVMHIGGHLWESPDDDSAASYRWSRYPAIWGWATWSDRWRRFDMSMRRWMELRDTDWLDSFLEDHRAALYWKRIFDEVTRGLDAWDYAWTFACWAERGLCARPTVNLVHNIGFGDDATHTRDLDNPAGHRMAGRMAWPLVHPSTLEWDDECDDLVEWANFSGMRYRQMLLARDRMSTRRPGSHES